MVPCFNPTPATGNVGVLGRSFSVTHDRFEMDSAAYSFPSSPAERFPAFLRLSTREYDPAVGAALDFK